MSDKHQQRTTMNGNNRWLESAHPILILPALLIGSAYLPWIVVSGFIQMEYAGTELYISPLIIGGGLAVAASWVYESGKYRVDAWIAGGLLIEGAILWTVVRLNQGIEAYKQSSSGDILGEMVSIDLGIGLFLAAIVSAVIILVGVREYRTSARGFAMRDVIRGLVNTN
ncbi:hypothetical protein [Salinigranum halophilum]|uniref:hypothetical protein n=1 Tax=Salinigranum halophilum TaxID=2565931 RepID=UPI0010A79490|nr:hypothetical protein [Salinigranum halophilum]